jgi:hypothetical protein
MCVNQDGSVRGTPLRRKEKSRRGEFSARGGHSPALEAGALSAASYRTALRTLKEARPFPPG